jgi:hypothetical protein
MRIHAAAAARVELGDDLLGQEEHVVAAIAQGRQEERHDPDAVEEVAPEAAGGDLGAQRAVGGGDDAHVDGPRVASAHRGDGAPLDGAQELGLQLERQLGDLVEEQRPALRLPEVAGVVAHRAGEGAAHVTEELALEEGAGERGAVERAEGPVAARREAWMARATSSLPAPVSPRTSTPASPRATLSMRWEEPLHRRVARPHVVKAHGAPAPAGSTPVHVEEQQPAGGAEPQVRTRTARSPPSRRRRGTVAVIGRPAASASATGRCSASPQSSRGAGTPAGTSMPSSRSASAVAATTRSRASRTMAAPASSASARTTSSSAGGGVRAMSPG